MVDSPCSSRSLATFTSLPLPAAALGASADCAEPARLALARLRSAPLDSPSSRYGPPSPRRQAAAVWHHSIAAESGADGALSQAAPPSLSMLTMLQPYLPAMLSAFCHALTKAKPRAYWGAQQWQGRLLVGKIGRRRKVCSVCMRCGG